MKKMKVCREETEAYPRKMEPNQEEMKSIAKHQGNPDEETTALSIGAQEARYGDRRLIVRRHEWPKKRNQGHGG
jgi:hypothetical protein